MAGKRRRKSAIDLKLVKFDPTEYINKITEEAELKGIANTLEFHTLKLLFAQMYNVCIKAYDEAISNEMLVSATNRNGDNVVKSNPLLKDYASLHKSLETTVLNLRKLLDGAKVVEKDDDYFM